MHKKKYWIVLSLISILSMFMACGNEINHITPESMDSVAVTESEKAKDGELQDIPKKLIYIVILPVCQYPKKNEIIGL